MSLEGIAVEPDSDLVVVQSGPFAPNVIRVDPRSGEQTVVFSGDLIVVGAIAIDTNGDYLITERSGSLSRIDPLTRSKSTITSGGFLANSEDVSLTIPVLLSVPEPSVTLMMMASLASLVAIKRSQIGR